MRLQAAWDAGDVAALTSLTTPEMLEELLHVLTTAWRDAEPHRRRSPCTPSCSASRNSSAAYLASVEFSGFIRESAERGAVPFRELWMLARTKDDVVALASGPAAIAVLSSSVCR